MLRGKQLPILTARLGPDKAIGISLVNNEKPLYTHCKIHLKLGKYTADLRTSYYWNGANLPKITWSLLGLNPLDPRIALASGFHDDGCEDDEVPQVLADAIFVALLGPIEFNGIRLEGISKFEQVCCYVGVRFYSLFIRPQTRLFFRREVDDAIPKV